MEAFALIKEKWRRPEVFAFFFSFPEGRLWNLFNQLT
jgi:hypothetical protein